MRLPVRCAPGTTLLVAAWRGHGSSGLRRCAHHDGTGDGGVADGRLAHAAERAVAEAAAILRAFVVPPGGQRLAKAPDVLKVPSSTLVSTALVDDVSFWRAPGLPQAVLAWEQAHLPPPVHARGRRFRAAVMGPHVLAISDSRRAERPGPGGRGSRSGQRTDRDPGGRPGELAAARQALERVPSAARVVTITQLPSLDPHVSRPPAPVTITDLAVVRRLAALLDSLQLSTIGPGASCPVPPGGGIQLAFLARAGGPLLAVAQGPAACGTVQFSAAGKPQPALQITDSFIPQVLKLADLNWKVP